MNNDERKYNSWDTSTRRKRNKLGRGSYGRNSHMSFGILGIIVSVVAIAFVYAGFTGTLNINGTGNVVSSKWDIYFANLSNAVTTGSANVLEAPTIQTKTSIGDYLVELIESGDSVTYTFDVVNDGSFDALLTVLRIGEPDCRGENSTSNQTACNNLEYTLKYTSNGQVVKESDPLLKGETKNMTLKISLKSNVDLSGVTRDVEIGGLGIMMMYSQASGYNGSGTIVNSEDNDVVIYNGSNKDYIFSGENVLEHTNNDIEYTLSISEGYKLKAGNYNIYKYKWKLSNIYL